MSDSGLRKKVVVTGLGVTSTLGTDVATFWASVNTHKLGYERLNILDEKRTPFNVGGHLGDLSDISQVESSGFERATRLALHAASQAVLQARMSGAEKNVGNRTIGVVIGTTCGANDAIEAPDFDENWFSGNPDNCPNEAFEKYNHSEIANAVSRTFGFDGPSYVVGTACAAGNQAVGEGVDLIRSGQADIVLCGGSDAFTLLPLLGFYSIKSLARDRCLPFDRSRDGTVLGEGAAVLVLEDSESARARGVVPLAEVRGWAINCDATKFATPLESGERCEQLIRLCLQDAKLDLEDIDYINVHGTGTQTNDLMEGRGISLAYKHAKNNVPISSIKGVLGHTMGAAGAFGAVTSTLAIKHGSIPPNTPISELDEGIDLNVVTEPLSKTVRHVLSLSFAFGGCNVATLFSKIPDVVP